MGVELHLPDLPEVPLSIAVLPGAAGPVRRHAPWHARLIDALQTYLPLLLMALLALATWWLIKLTPGAAPVAPAAAVRSEPDYTMTQFALERFDAQGRLSLRMEGERLRHYPDTDRIEVDAVRIRSVAPDGRLTTASARRAIGKGDGSEMQLLGDASVDSGSQSSDAITLRGEFLHAFFITEQVRSHLPVLVTRGGTELQAAGLFYDHPARKLELSGRTRAVFTPVAVRQ